MPTQVFSQIAKLLGLGVSESERQKDQVDKAAKKNSVVRAPPLEGRYLVARARGFWEHAVVSTPEDYLDLMRLLVRMDTIIARGWSDSVTRLHDQVWMPNLDAHEVIIKMLGSKADDQERQVLDARRIEAFPWLEGFQTMDPCWGSSSTQHLPSSGTSGLYIHTGAELPVQMFYARGNLRSYSDIWKRYTVCKNLSWKLYQLKTNGKPGLEAPLLVELPLTEEQCTQTTHITQPQFLTDLWKDILELERQPGGQGISWLIEIRYGLISEVVPYYQTYANENMRGLISLSKRWQCRIYSGYSELEPLSHGVLGAICIGTKDSVFGCGAPVPGKYGPEHPLRLHHFVKDIRSIRVSHRQVRIFGPSEEVVITEFIQRFNGYDHPNVLSLEGIVPMYHAGFGVGLVFRQTSTMSLAEYLDVAPDVDRCRLCARISSGLMYLNDAGVIHGRLRAANVLVSLTGEAIISDPSVLGSGKFNSEPGQVRWLAPEVLTGKPPSRASDIFSLGLTILEIINDTPPYTGKDDAELLSNLTSGPQYIPPERPENNIPRNSKDGDDLWNVLLCCWNFNPRNRPHMAHVVEVMRSITQDGLKVAYQERTDALGFKRGAFLALHGCENLTDHVDEGSLSRYPLFRGGFGDVYRGNLLGGLLIAVKTPHIPLNVLEENAEDIKDAAREIHTWSKCDHPNVLQFLGLALFRDQIGMVAPWMEHGSLPGYLKKTLSVDRCKLCAQICEGVAYLHNIGIVHGDLKGLSENVLVSSKGAPVVSDFGGSLLKNRSLKIVPLEKEPCVTYRWAAPELFEDEVITKESDAYALGMTILEVITDRLPWHWVNREVAIMKQVCSSRAQHKRPEDEIPTNSQDGDRLWDLLVASWSFVPNQRPTAVEMGGI
ncbi:unnamed protein product, partial [Rhizoctonia solani]